MFLKRVGFGVLALLSITGCSVGLSNHQSTQNSLNIPFNKSAKLDIGKGIDTVSEEILGGCIETSPEDFVVTSHNTLKGGWYFGLIRSRDELEHMLNLTPADSLSPGLIPFSTSFQSRFVYETSINSFTVYAMLRIHLLTGKGELTRHRFKSHIVDVLQKKWMDQFHVMCGDEFLNSIDYGGELVMLFRFSADNIEKRNELQAEINAFSKLVSFDGMTPQELKPQFDAHFKSGLTRVFMSAESFPTGFQSGGTFITLPQLNTADSIITTAQRFIDEIANQKNVTPLRAESIYYSEIKLPDFQGVKPRDTSKQKKVLQSLNYLRQQLREKQDDLNYVISNSFKFTSDDVAKALNNRENVSRKMYQISEATSECFYSKNNCALPEIELPEFDIPRIKNEL